MPHGKHSEQQASPTAMVLGGRFLSALVSWFIQWQASDLRLISCLITLACSVQPRRSQFRYRERESCLASYTRWHGRTKFRRPHHRSMANDAAVLCLTVSFACVLQKYLGFNLIAWQNLIEINAEALLWGVPLWLFHSNWVVSSSMSFPLDSPTLTFSSQVSHTLTLYLTQLTVRFPISPPHYSTFIYAKKQPWHLWTFTIHRAGTWKPVSENTSNSSESQHFRCLKQSDFLKMSICFLPCSTTKLITANYWPYKATRLDPSVLSLGRAVLLNTAIALTAQHVHCYSPAAAFLVLTPTPWQIQMCNEGHLSKVHLALNHLYAKTYSIVITLYYCLSTVTAKHLISTWRFPILYACNAIPITSLFSQHAT